MGQTEGADGKVKTKENAVSSAMRPSQILRDDKEPFSNEPLSEEERNRLEGMIHSGKHPAQRLMKARILLKADTSEAGEGWSDRQIAQALETSAITATGNSNAAPKATIIWVTNEKYSRTVHTGAKLSDLE